MFGLPRAVVQPLASAGLTALVLATTAASQSEPDLIRAVKTGQTGTIQTLLEGGANPDIPQGDGATALHHAAHQNDITSARLLIEAGATVTIGNELGATPLWLAARNGSTAIVDRLLDAGADANVTLIMGETPLMTAARGGHLETVRLLLSRGAGVNATEQERHQTALMWAVAQGHVRVVQLLIASGADIHARTTVWDQLENTAGNTNPIGNFRMSHGGSTPLLFAARHGSIDVTRVLLEAGANVNDISAAGTSALVIAAHSGHGPLGTFLLEQGADPNAAGAGYTALHAAVLRSQVQLVQALLLHGADVNAPLNHGTPGRRFSADYSLRYQLIGANAFWLAAKYGELDIIRLLAAGGADPLAVPESGVSALQAAMGIPQGTENRRNRVVSAYQPGPDKNNEERLAVELARVAIALGADVNAGDARGNTTLHHAVRQRFKPVITLLAEAGADLNVANDRGETPLNLAEGFRPVQDPPEDITHQTIASLLRQLGAQ